MSSHHINDTDYSAVPISEGLTAEQVVASRDRYGSNVLTPPAKTSLWKRFFEKLTGPFGHHIKGWADGDPLIFILEVAALLSIFISFAEYFGWMGMTRATSMTVFFEPMGILIAILLATGIAFLFELKADREFSILNQVSDDEPVEVIRDGTAQRIGKKDVVVGDIVILSTGDEIPADGTLVQAVAMQVDESSLTGEPICEKTTNPQHFDANATYASNQVMRGTKVMEGHGVYRVSAVGDRTEHGKVFVAAQIDNCVKTPLNEQLDRLGSLISKASYAVAVLVVVGRIISYLFNDDFVLADFLAYLLQTFMIAVTLIVVAVPEGLPMAVTLSLAYSMRRMLHTNNLVRRMHACETMGAATVICTDKTGTLTQNRMEVAHAHFFGHKEWPEDGDERQLATESLAVNSTARLHTTKQGNYEVLGNPTEGALLLFLQQYGIDIQHVRESVHTLDEIPFSTERKFMATEVLRSDGTRIVYVKGAPEMVLSMCEKDTSETSLSDVHQQLSAYQQQGMRTLAFAYQQMDGEKGAIADHQLVAPQLHLLGIVAISDPVRSDVPAAVAECLQAGISVKIVTGDTPATAREIARQIGLWHADDGDESIITGTDLAALSDDELNKRVGQLKIIARARPMDKRRLVMALQHNNEVVAVTGDGTNDAPALKTAHVGLSMGDGTSVAKEASDITIIDNSFSSIGRAVMWGRSLYRNIQRFILFQLTVNVAACLIVLVGSFMGTESPLTVTQMLWVNLIMDTFAAMALSSLPPSKAVMNEAPRPRQAFIISRPMKHFILVMGLLFFFILLALLYWFENSNITLLTDLGSVPTGRKDGLSPYELSLFFTIFVMLQFWNLFNARAFATGHSAFQLKGCKGFIAIAIAIFIGQVAIIHLGGAFFNATPLHFADWLIIVGSTSLVAIIGELIRMKSRMQHVRSTSK